MNHLKRLLLPFSWLYGEITLLRNTLFDWGVLTSKAYPIPIINVGNITVGGTGKTPHVEFLIRLLSPNYQVAVLSRGYKRKSKGYHLANDSSTMQELGDEPWQIKQKFPHIQVAVDANRRRGIHHLLTDSTPGNVEVILLDDAYQHRYVKPGMNILLTDYRRLLTRDYLMPMGRLRESIKGKDRADMILVTKCPTNLSSRECKAIEEELQPLDRQRIFFTTLVYEGLKHLFLPIEKRLEDLSQTHVLLLNAIGNPQQMLSDVSPYVASLHPIHFRDHHYFNQEDLAMVERTYRDMKEPKIIVTTEKDATRLVSQTNLPPCIKEAIYMLPIRVAFLRNEEELFNKTIIEYVQQDSRNHPMVKK